MKTTLVTLFHAPNKKHLVDTGETHPWDKTKTPKDRKSLEQMIVYGDKLLAVKYAYADHNQMQICTLRPTDDQLNSLQLTTGITDPYQALNFYKLLALEWLSTTTDRIVFLDFDVVPKTLESIVEYYPALAVKFQKVDRQAARDFTKNTEYRSVEQKFRDLMAVVMQLGDDIEGQILDLGIVNTGIIVATSAEIERLQLSADLAEYLDTARQLGQIPNNEVYFTKQLLKSCLPFKQLSERWHFIYDNMVGIEHAPEDVVMVHTISKRFDKVL